VAARRTRRRGRGDTARRVGHLDITGTAGTTSRTSLTLQGLTVEGVVLWLRDAHVAVVEATLLDVSVISADMETDHVTIDVINSTWTRRYPNLTTCQVGVSTSGDVNGCDFNPNHMYSSTVENTRTTD